MTDVADASAKRKKPALSQSLLQVAKEVLISGDVECASVGGSASRNSIVIIFLVYFTRPFKPSPYKCTHGTE